MARKRKKKPRITKPRLTIKQILAWSDAYYLRHGHWPKVLSGVIPGTDGEKWRNVDNALSIGLRGQPGGSSLTKLLARRRNKWNLKGRPLLMYRDILRWADAHHRRTGRWPIAVRKPVVGAPGETWLAIDGALKLGSRGLPGGSSRARFLAERRGVRNRKDLPLLKMQDILKWMDQHHRRTGRWPDPKSGPIPRSGGESWRTVSKALWLGTGGQKPRQTLAALAVRYRGARVGKYPRFFGDFAPNKGPLRGRQPNRAATVRERCVPTKPVCVLRSLTVAALFYGRATSTKFCQSAPFKRLSPLTVRQILAWADAYHRRVGKWPKTDSGPIPNTNHETWSRVASALNDGRRGLPRISLPQLLLIHRGVPGATKSSPAAAKTKSRS